MIGNGKIIEDLKLTQLVAAARVVTAITEFNAATAASASGIDTQNYDEIIFILNTGNFAGDGTLDAIVMESATDSASAAVAVTSAAFTQVTSANDLTHQLGFIRCADTLRYLFLRTAKAGTGSVHYSSHYVLGKPYAYAQSNSPVFDLRP